MAIRIACPCGKYYKAPDRLAGKTVKCPGCGNPLPVPSPHEGDLLEELADLEAAAEQARLSSASGIDQHLSSASGTGLSSPSLTMAPKKPAKTPPPIPFILGGLIAVICLILIIILIARPPRTDDLVETKSQDDPATLHSNASTDTDDTEIDADADESPTNGAGSNLESARSSDPRNGSSMRASDRGQETAIGSATASRANAPGDETPSGQQSGRSRQAATDREPGSGNSLPIQGGRGNHRPNPNRSGTTSPDAAVRQSDRITKHIHESLPRGCLAWYDGPNDLLATRRPEDTLILELQYGWMVELLPHLGYQAEYDKLNFDKHWQDEQNLEVVKQVIPEFLNPMDPRKHYSGYMFSGLGLTHFVGVSGVDTGRNVTAARLPRSDPRAGIFGYNEIARRDQITDGAAHTIMLIGSGELVGPWAVAGGQTVRAAREPYFHRLSGFGSKGHARQGATAVMADGSVRWIDANIDPEVFRAMCTIHGGESVDLSGPSFDLP